MQAAPLIQEWVGLVGIAVIKYVFAFHRTVLPSPADGSATPEVPSVLEQLVTHVPDLIVYRSHDAPLPQTIHSYGVVMFGDISGSLYMGEIFGLINYAPSFLFINICNDFVSFRVHCSV